MRTDASRLPRLVLFTWLALFVVVLAALVAPGPAFAFQGRLSGTIWPISPTEAAHYSAVLLATSAILWFCRIIWGRHADAAVSLTALVLVANRTRTALTGAVVGLALAAASLFLGHARVRRVSLSAITGAIVGAALFAPQIVGFLARGQSASQVAQLSGRTDVWSDVIAAPRPWNQTIFGAGLSKRSFQVMEIDSNWVAAYLDQGWFGIVIQATILVVLLAMVVTHVRGPHRALALFLIAYCAVASVTDSGLGEASPHILDLVVAVSLLSTPARWSDR